ncbi:MAG: hypothetical protein CSYNP_00467 [Syntrophus sp. SKADARSKE-3]|nr:hypothetical protein [Syntrophus sp. SKADARSKE-3]
MANPPSGPLERGHVCCVALNPEIVPCICYDEKHDVEKIQMKKSRSITLILLTSSLFLGCQDKVRNQYATWDDCVKDYRDPSKCEAEKQYTSTGYHMIYHGPWYRPSSSTDYARNPSSVTKRAIGITRGGFGAGGARASS